MAAQNDQSVTRGCLATTDTCTEPSCLSCETSNCNKHNLCKSCNSTTTAECAQTNATTLSNAICSSADTKCMISVMESRTERGCITAELETNCTNEKTCKMCTGALCNVGIFPADRLNCTQCTESDANCASASSNIVALPCLLYAADDKCYMYASDATHVTRGCSSDASESNKCAANSTDALCKTCSTNDCNGWSYNADQTLQCVTCSSATDAQCAWGQAASNATSCTNQLEYSQEGKCYTRTDANGTVTRGCYYDLDEAAQTTCAQGINCTICTNANGCNNVDAKNFTCIRCRSDNFAGCRKQADKIGGEKCTNLVTSDEEAKCFTSVWNNDLVIRGCVVDLDDTDKLICNDTTNESCQVCNTTNCNTKAVNNGAAYLLLSNGLLAAALLTMWRLK
ncbi:prestalk protein-like [Rhagoletis pomonella]|uniref:prestalk protein-like n=1 Tax=Rhagoletis pomonella TaxID=28610 RepID=UPI0017866F61|nr:prestalk protein-like [Rhagoletis pomonella]